MHRKLALVAASAAAVASLSGCASPADVAQFTPMRRVTTFAPVAHVEQRGGPLAQPTPAINLVRRGPPPAPAPAPVWVSQSASSQTVVDLPFGGVRASDLAPIEALAAQIQQMHTLDTVTVTGYADSIGPAVANQRLSLRRALFVKALLIARGVPAAKIDVVGAGATDFVVSPDTCTGNLHAQSVCQAPNRRVQITAVGTTQVLVPGGQ